MKLVTVLILSLHLLAPLQLIHSQVDDTTMSKIYAMDIEELMNTTVSIATKSNQSITETPSVVSVITSEEIKNMGARELEDIMQMVPGFELTRSYQGYFLTDVRGVKDSKISSKVLILVDGIPLNQPFFGNSFSWGYDINIDNIEKIEIIRGPGSALYGRNAFSAVINIINKTARKEKEISFKGTLGSFNTKSASLNLGFNKNKIRGMFATRLIHTDVTDEKFDNGFGQTVPYNLFRKNFSFNSNVNFGNFYFTGMFLNLYGGGSFNKSYIENRIATYSLGYINQLSPKMRLNTKIYGSNSLYIEDIEQVPANLDYPVPGLDGTTRFMDIWPLGIYYKPQNKNYLYGFESELNYKLASNNDLLVGLQADMHGVYDVIIPTNVNFTTLAPYPGIGRDNLINYEPGWFDKNKHNYYNLAILFQDIWYIQENFGFTIGARYDRDSETGGIFNPRTGLVYTPFKNISIKLLYGKAYRAPSPSEQYVTLGYAIGNKNLKPEIINTFEMSVSHKNKIISQSLNLYLNKLKDMIYTAQIAYIDPRNSYYNIGKNTSIGFEYENKIVLGKKYFSYFNYSFSHSKNTDNNNGSDTTFNHPNIANHKINIGINYLIINNININFNMYYRSKMDPLKIENSNLFVQTKVGDYAIFNSTLTFNKFIINNLCLKLSAYNLFDTQYSSQDNQHLISPSQPGRQFWASLIVYLL